MARTAILAGRRRSLSLGLAIAIGIMALLAALGVSRASSATEVAGGTGTLVWAKGRDVTALDPANDPGVDTNWKMFQLVYDRLVDQGPKLQPVPNVATSWKQVSPTVYEFKIRRGVRFSNGRELTVRDVTGSFRRLINPKNTNSWRGKAGQIKTVRAIAPWTVRFTLARPHSAFLAALMNADAAIIPMKELTAGTFDPAKEMLGSGPFKVVSHSQDQSWTLDGNPYYWRGKSLPRVAKLNVRIMTSDAARLAGLRSGSVHIADFDNPDVLDLLKGSSNIKVVTQQSTNIYYVSLNNSPTSIFQNQQLRRALALSLNRRAVIAQGLGGRGSPTAAVSPSYGNLCPAGAMPDATQNIAEAQRLVSAGGATGKTLDFIAATTDSTYLPIAQVVAKDLEAIGFKVNIQTLDSGGWTKAQFSGPPLDFDLSVSWYAGSADPTIILGNWNSVISPWQKDYSQSTPQMEAVIDRARATPPGPARDRAIRQACESISRAANVIPLVTRAGSYVAYRNDKIRAAVQPLEGNAVTLRYISQYSVR